MLDQSDLECVAHAQAGEVDALGALYDRHNESIFRYVWSRVGDRPLAEDLTGEVFTRMLAALPGYRPTGLPFRAWLFRIAHNLLVDHFRRANGRATVPLDTIEEWDEGGIDLATTVERQLTVERAQAALARLDHAQREVVVLRFLCGLSLREVSLALDKSEAAIKSLQHRGLSALREALAQEQVTS